MQNGYGNTILSYLKQFEECSLTTPSRLPFIGGRDCSGTVVYRGREVKKFKEGDEVRQSVVCKNVAYLFITSFNV